MTPNQAFAFAIVGVLVGPLLTVAVLILTEFYKARATAVALAAAEKLAAIQRQADQDERQRDREERQQVAQRAEATAESAKESAHLAAAMAETASAERKKTAETLEVVHAAVLDGTKAANHSAEKLQAVLDASARGNGTPLVPVTQERIEAANLGTGPLAPSGGGVASVKVEIVNANDNPVPVTDGNPAKDGTP